MKDIWNKFKLDCANAWSTFCDGIKAMAKSTFEILKDGCVDFITAIFTWLWELLKGVGLIGWSLVQVVVAALIAAVKATFGLTYNKIVDWIKHW